MHWIERFSKGSFRLFSGQVLESFLPLDFYHFFPLWYDLWIKRIALVLKVLNAESKSFKDLAEFLPTPSNIRAILVKIIPSFRSFHVKNVEEVRAVADFLARMLTEMCPQDPFCIHSNLIHRKDQIEKTVKSVSWQHANKDLAKEVGKLITAAGSLVHGLYNDVVTDFGWDAYGPYSISLRGKRYSLLIRHFPNLCPRELWPKKYLAGLQELFIYALYQNVEWEIAYVGCHTLVKQGNPVSGMKKFSIIADNKVLSAQELARMIYEMSSKAERIYYKIHAMDFEELKLKVLLQECFQLKKLFDSAKIDWKPTPEMISRVKNKKLLSGILPHGRMMKSLKEYKRIFGIDQFAREVYHIKL